MTAQELFLEAMRRTDAGDLDGFIELQAPDVTWVTPSGEVHGHDELRGWLAVWVSAFPNERRHQLDRVVEIDGRVYCEGVFHGVNEGPMETPNGTLPVTGKSVALRFAIAVDTDVDAGHANRVQLYLDQLELLAQLGMMPAAA